MNHSSIEFMPMPENAGQQVRRFFRIPVDAGQSICVLIASISYPVADISLGGVSLFLENDQAFEIGENLDSCQLQFANKVLTDLTGSVVHRSAPVLGSDLWQYGIQWTHMKDLQKKELEQMLNQLKKSVLASSNISLPEETDEEK